MTICLPPLKRPKRRSTKLHKLATICSTREVTIARLWRGQMERTHSTQQGSFIYAGCYAPTAGLSIAQRAAWGLFQADQPSQREVHTPHAPVQHLQAKGVCRSLICQTSFVRHTVPKWVFHYCRLKKRIQGFPSALHSSSRQSREKATKLRSIRTFTAYRRFEAIVDGRRICCTVFKSRSFLGACEAPRAPK
jgi:hypothetical protein